MPQRTLSRNSPRALPLFLLSIVLEAARFFLQPRAPNPLYAPPGAAQFPAPIIPNFGRENRRVHCAGFVDRHRRHWNSAGHLNGCQQRIHPIQSARPSGTPITGSVVFAAITPARCAAAPAPTIRTFTPRAIADVAYRGLAPESGGLTQLPFRTKSRIFPGSLPLRSSPASPYPIPSRFRQLPSRSFPSRHCKVSCSVVCAVLKLLPLPAVPRQPMTRDLWSPRLIIPPSRTRHSHPRCPRNSSCNPCRISSILEHGLHGSLISRITSRILNC